MVDVYTVVQGLRGRGGEGEGRKGRGGRGGGRRGGEERGREGRGGEGGGREERAGEGGGGEEGEGRRGEGRRGEGRGGEEVERQRTVHVESACAVVAVLCTLSGGNSLMISATTQTHSASGNRLHVRDRQE